MALLRPDLVKLDMSLVRDVHQDPVRTRMIRSIGTMCEQLAIPWLCEGVETAEELRALVAVGCDLVQGYIFAQPMGDEDFAEWVQSRSELGRQVARA